VAFLGGHPVGFILHIFVAENFQIGEITEEFVGLEHETVLTCEAFDDEQATRLQRATEAADIIGFRRVIPGMNVKHSDQVPAALTQVVAREIVDDGVQFDSQACGLASGLLDGDVREVHASDSPALLSKEDCVAALAHAEVDGRARFSVANCGNQQLVWPVIEIGLGIVEFFVPEIAIVIQALRRGKRGQAQDEREGSHQAIVERAQQSAALKRRLLHSAFIGDHI